MTHDELLIKIDILGHTSTWKALRAVVELHKPEQGWCGCASGDPYLDSNYPCPTIQAIEKELG